LLGPSSFQEKCRRFGNSNFKRTAAHAGRWRGWKTFLRLHAEHNNLNALRISTGTGRQSIVKCKSNCSWRKTHHWLESARSFSVVLKQKLEVYTRQLSLECRHIIQRHHSQLIPIHFTGDEENCWSQKSNLSRVKFRSVACTWVHVELSFFFIFFFYVFDIFDLRSSREHV